MAIPAWVNIAAVVGGAYYQNRNNRKTTNQVVQQTEEVVDSMAGYIEEARDIAQELIVMGEERAAAAIIEGTQKGVAAVWQGANLGHDSLQRFLQSANAYLEPTIRQGRYAENEIASMLGIPNASGKKEPWNPKLIEDTPGYKFQYEWGKRAVENSAVGKYLSGQQARELTEFGQGLAGSYFDRRVNQLDQLAGRGATAAEAAGRNNMVAGQTAAQLFGNAGQAAGDLELRGALGLANVLFQSPLEQAKLISDATSTIANITATGVAASNQGLVSSQNNQNNFVSDILTGIMGIPALTGGSQNTNANPQAMGSLGSMFGVSSPNYSINNDVNSIPFSNSVNNLSEFQ